MPCFNVTYDVMLSIKSIKLPSIHVDFLLLCSCQVSSHSEYFIIICVSLMSDVGGKTPISDHRGLLSSLLHIFSLSAFVFSSSVFPSLGCLLTGYLILFDLRNKQKIVAIRNGRETHVIHHCEETFPSHFFWLFTSGSSSSSKSESSG